MPEANTRPQTATRLEEAKRAAAATRLERMRLQARGNLEADDLMAPLEPKRPRPRWRRLAVVLGVATLLVAVELVALAFFSGFPVVSSVAWVFESTPDDAPATVELTLGEFHESNHSFPGIPTQVTMEMAVDVPVAEEGPARELIDRHRRDLRDVVSQVIRTASLRELEEPSMQTIKRRCRVALQRATAGDFPTPEAELLIAEFNLSSGRPAFEPVESSRQQAVGLPSFGR